MKIREGDGILPEHKQWRGSAGLVYDENKFWTCNHVIPEVGMKVYDSKTGKLIGECIWTNKIKWVEWWDWLFQRILGVFGFDYPLPVNKVDGSLIKLYDDIVIEKFKDTPDVPVEGKPGDRVYKAGSTSGDNEGNHGATGLLINVWGPDGKMGIFDDIGEFDNITNPGDSGGAGRLKKGQLGTVFAGEQGGRKGFYIPIGNAIKAHQESKHFIYSRDHTSELI